MNVSDVRDPHSLRALVRGQDVLFNLAGQTSHLDSMTDPFTDLDINCRAQLSILEACRRHNPGVRSSSPARGRSTAGRATCRSTRQHPVAPGRRQRDQQGRGRGVPPALRRGLRPARVASLRLTNTYGPRMRVRDARQTFLGVWLQAVLLGRAVRGLGRRQPAARLLYVDDAVRRVPARRGAADEADGEVFNVGVADVGHAAPSSPSCSSRVARRRRVRLVPFPPDRKAIDIGDYYASRRQDPRALGWEPRSRSRTGCGARSTTTASTARRTGAE